MNSTARISDITSRARTSKLPCDRMSSMGKPNSIIAPTVAIVLLLLPVLYVGSYLGMVDRKQRYLVPFVVGESPWAGRTTSYRRWGWICESVYWPLEQIDRRMRPGAWEAEVLHDLLHNNHPELVEH